MKISDEYGRRGPNLGWEPYAKNRALLMEIHKVLDEYRAHLPLSVRSICYILVGKGKLDKTKGDFRKAADAMVCARRAVDNPLHIPMDALSGDELEEHEIGRSFDGSPDEYLRKELRWLSLEADGYRRDLLATQPDVIEVWCEARGMLNQVIDAAEPYGVRCLSRGGFFPLRAGHDLGKKAADSGKRHVILFITDLDLAGIELYLSAIWDTRDWAEYYGGEVIGRRIAITPAQVTGLGLESAPERKSYQNAEQRIDDIGEWDPEIADFLADGATFAPKRSVLPAVQAEAMPPDLRAGVIRDAIEAHMDLHAWNEAKDRQAAERADLAERTAGINERLATFTESELARISDAEGELWTSTRP